MNIPTYIGGKAKYDPNGQQIFSEDGQKLLLDVRGWGELSNQFKDDQEAAKFQDRFGQWVVEAINEKVEREVVGDPKERAPREILAFVSQMSQAEKLLYVRLIFGLDKDMFRLYMEDTSRFLDKWFLEGEPQETEPKGLLG